MDEGDTKVYSIMELYEIEKKFLEVKFQAVLATIDKFEHFNNCLYLKEIINSELSNKKFTARRTQRYKILKNMLTDLKLIVIF